MVNETYAIAELFFARFFGGSEVEFFVALLSRGCVFANIEGKDRDAFDRPE